MDKPDTEAMIIGARVFDYPWWMDTDADFEHETVLSPAPEGWKWTITPLDPDGADEGTAGTPVDIGHDELMKAIKKIATGKVEATRDCIKQCILVNAGMSEYADFDAVTADEVLQIAVYGTVVFW